MPYSSATTIGNWNEERAWRETGSEAPLSARAFGRRAPLSAEEELQRNKGHHPSHITNWERDDADRQTRTQKLPTAAHDTFLAAMGGLTMASLIENQTAAPSAPVGAVVAARRVAARRAEVPARGCADGPISRAPN